jgi:hypothetical protein
MKEFFEDIKNKVSHLVCAGYHLSNFYTEIFIVLPMSVRLFGYLFETTEKDICYLYLYENHGDHKKIEDYCFEIQFDESLEVIHVAVVSNPPE